MSSDIRIELAVLPIKESPVLPIQSIEGGFNGFLLGRDPHVLPMLVAPFDGGKRNMVVSRPSVCQ